jgi:histidinol dehydrogenase
VKNKNLQRLYKITLILHLSWSSANLIPSLIMARYLKKPTEKKKPQTQSTDLPVIVKNVIDSIRSEGDAAVRRYSEQFDKWVPIKLSHAEIMKTINEVPEQTIIDIKEAQDNIRRFAAAQRESVKEFEVEIQPGVYLGQKHNPISCVGAYVPLSIVRLP